MKTKINLTFALLISMFISVAGCELQTDDETAAMAAGGAGGAGGEGGTDDGVCEVGAEKCACYANDTCDDGLKCLSDHCVEPPGSGTGGEGGCPVGAETCECFPNDTCNPGLKCLSDICVDAGTTTGSGGTSGSTGSGGSSSGSGGSTGSTSFYCYRWVRGSNYTAAQPMYSKGYIGSLYWEGQMTIQPSTTNVLQVQTELQSGESFEGWLESDTAPKFPFDVCDYDGAPNCDNLGNFCVGHAGSLTVWKGACSDSSLTSVSWSYVNTPDGLTCTRNFTFTAP